MSDGLRPRRTREASRRFAALCALSGAVGGCSGVPRAEPHAGGGVRSAAPPVARTPAPPPASDSRAVIESHNARVAALSRLWANATAQVFYTDQDGNRRWEQGEGHFQYLAPSRLGLTIGKLGQRVFRLGCDDERYWLFELAGADRASVGRHENVGMPCARALGLAINPLELIDLLGFTPMDEDARASAAVSGDGKTILLSRPVRSGTLCCSFDGASAEPRRVEVFVPGAPEPSLVAELEQYETITLLRAGGIGPRIPTRVVIRHPKSETEIRLHLHDASTGKPEQLSDEAFDFDSLVDALAPGMVRAVDAECAAPGVSPEWLRERGYAPTLLSPLPAPPSSMIAPR